MLSRIYDDACAQTQTPEYVLWRVHFNLAPDAMHLQGNDLVGTLSRRWYIRLTTCHAQEQCVQLDPWTNWIPS